MRARAGKIEVLDARVAVVPAKIGALQQCWRQAEGAPEMRGEILFEVRRRILDLRDDPLAKVRDQAPLDLGDDALRQFRSFDLPVERRMTAMGNRRKRIKTAVARGGHARIACARVKIGRAECRERGFEYG